MRHRSTLPAALALWLAAALGQACSQPALAPAATAQPHEALAFFEGSWTTSDARPEDDFKETCAWLPEARRHMVCRSRWRADTGYREGMSIFSYEPSSGDYRYHGFRSGGAVVVQSGQRLPQGWVFTSDRGTGADRVQARVTIERVTPDRFSFLSESAKGGGPWLVGARFDYLRVAR
jgi:hypothetical protein